jgi:peptidoglycan/LPS O-acetylase OafA/YrhL
VSCCREPSPPAPHDDHEVQGAAEAGRGGGGQQQQHFLAVCIPDECSNEKDAQKITSDYAHYGLMHYWLAGGTTVEPKAPPLDTNAKIVIGFVFASAALCIVSTLLNSSWLTTCKAAMPMAENVSKRVRAQVAKCPHRADEIAAMCELDQWQFVLQMEAAEESGITPGGPGSIQGEGTLQQTLLPKARPAGLERLNLQPAATRNGQTEDRGFCGKLLGCWDLGFNWRTGLMKQDGGVPEMRVLNGLRVLSMGWVVLCHGFLYQIMQANVQNKVYAQFDVGGRFLSALLPNGNFSVDTFFVLSGYLGAYVGMRKLNAMDRAGKKVPNVFVLAFNFLLERYLRLTPAYLFVLMFYMFVLPHIITGPHAITIEGKMAPDMNGIGGDFLYCQHYVWTNLLYISNLVPYHDHMFGTKYGDQFAGGQFGLHTAHGGLGCMGHSWFLSVDFQLHLLLPWLLVLFRWKPKPFYAVALAGIGANSAYLGFLVYEYHWSLGCHDRGFAGDTNTLYYGKPWCRISAWLVGVVLACYQSANSTRAGHLNPPGALLIAVGYVISGAVLFVCVFTPYWQQHHDESNPFADKSCGWSHTWDTIYR